MDKESPSLCFVQVVYSYRPPSLGKRHEITSVHLAATVSFVLPYVVEMTQFACSYGHDWPKAAHNSGE